MVVISSKILFNYFYFVINKYFSFNSSGRIKRQQRSRFGTDLKMKVKKTVTWKI